MNHNKRKELQKKKEELILGACKQCGKDISKLLYIQGDETQVGPLCPECMDKYSSHICKKLKTRLTNKEKRAEIRKHYQAEGSALKVV